MRGSRFCAAALLVLHGAWSRADVVHLDPAAFVESRIGAEAPAQALWLTRDVQARIARVLGHPYPQARLRYWRSERGMAFVLDEIGKEFPITAGFAVRNGRLVDARLLVYRESRGQEIGQSAFLRQFDGVGLTPSLDLDKEIDGITGATMSVDAMKRMARVALLLAGQIEGGAGR